MPHIPDSALVVPDASRILFSISQALTVGHHVHFGTNPGLLLHGSKQFIPFVRDEQSGMYLLPLYPPLNRHNGTYSLQVGAEAEQILPAIPIYTPPAVRYASLPNVVEPLVHSPVMLLNAHSIPPRTSLRSSSGLRR